MIISGLTIFVSKQAKAGQAFNVTKNTHSYFSLKPYWWPDVFSPSGFSRRDGERRPDSQLWVDGSEQYDRSRLQALYGNTTCLALAFLFTNDEKYSKMASRNIRAWFINPDTKMNPTMKFAQWVGELFL